ncbi:MAG TPA: hypothetical protein VN622_15445 [Clostridia bacterium]|nr:hypothetical protein [Clostridia bacterium]
MYTGTMINDLIAVVAKAEAHAETMVLMREELERVPFYAMAPYERTVREAVLMGVA